MNSTRALSGYFLTLLVGLTLVCCQDVRNGTNYDTSWKAYNTGVDMGIINPEKYPFESFLRDEQNVFRDLYLEYSSLNGTEPINYEEWLIMNNFGILTDTQESLFERKITKRSTADNKRKFVKIVRKGDILITGRGIGGLVGHAAIMTSDYWVLEMPGGKGWQNGLKSNNRQISKYRFFDIHSSDWTTVYRCPNGGIANNAATWADRNYYNPKGGTTKTIHITYRITTNALQKNPSYCSKLVIQAYYFGTGKNKVIRSLSGPGIIVPSTIPNYFLTPYKLKNLGKY